MLLGPDARREGLLVVAGQHRDAPLHDHLAGVDAGVDEVDAAAALAHALLQRLALRVQAAVLRQEARVDVEQPAVPPVHERRREDAHEAGEDHRIRYETVDCLSQRGIEGIAARLAYSSINNMFSLVWDEAVTIDMPDKLAQAVCATSNATWPHTFVVPKYARMEEYKQFAPANHFHMTWNLPVARLQHWMDLTNVLDVGPWADRPALISGVDRPAPLLHLLAGGEAAAKAMLSR